MENCVLASCQNIPKFVCDCSKPSVAVCSDHLSDHINGDSKNSHLFRPLLKHPSKSELLTQLSELHQKLSKEYCSEMQEKTAGIYKLLAGINEKYMEKFNALHILNKSAKDYIRSLSEWEISKGNILEDLNPFGYFTSKKAKEIVKQSEELRTEYRNQEIEELLTEALRETDRKYSVEILNQLGLTYIDMKQYERALSTFQESLEIHKENPHSDDLSIAELMNNIGTTYYKLDRLKESVNISIEAAMIVKKKYGNLHPHVAHSLHNIGYCCVKENRCDEGHYHYAEALDIIKSTGQYSSKQAATTLSNLAGIHYVKNDFDTALSYFKEALAIRCSILSSDHPELAQTLFHLGCIYYKYELFQDSLTYFTESLRINMKYYSDKSDIVQDNKMWVKFVQDKIK